MVSLSSTHSLRLPQGLEFTDVRLNINDGQKLSQHLYGKQQGGTLPGPSKTAAIITARLAHLLAKQGATITGPLANRNSRRASSTLARMHLQGCVDKQCLELHTLKI